ncbi:hypothetical protein GCM10017687_30940 [Streptomyces echinatus]|uniref:hypothetical protein n=1 Tax=Streptomyces echinatus TaxID=67293 RepID=UPI0031EBCA46
MPRARARAALPARPAHLANVGLLAVGIVLATAVSLMGMRHYLVGQIERRADQDAGLHQQLGGHPAAGRLAAVLDFVRDRITPQYMDQQATSDSCSTAVDSRGEPLALFGIQPTEAQAPLATAVAARGPRRGHGPARTSACTAPPTA